jgi:hypothetical protein
MLVDVHVVGAAVLLLKMLVPWMPGSTTGNVTVTVAGQTSTAPFTVLPAPNISSLSPTSGPIGQSVTVTGTNFGASQGTSTITFNGTLAAPTTWSNVSIVVPVPIGATTGNVVVRVGTVNSNNRLFTVLPAPTISNLSTTNGMPGTAVTITGTNFGATKGSSTVKFNGTTAATTTWNATTISATVPSGATSGPVVVTVNNVPSNGVSFTVPMLLSIVVSPSAASFPLNSKQQYMAIGSYSDGIGRDVTAVATWSSTAPAVAAVGATGLVTASALGQTNIQAAVGAVSGATVLDVTGPAFVKVGNLRTARWGHTATRLQDGRVLIVGGQDRNNDVLKSAEIYDPATGAFTPTGAMSITRVDAGAVLLTDGRVLITGGIQYDPLESLSSAEIYDPVAGVFEFAGYMNAPHFAHTATALPDGRVLIAGGHYLTEQGGGVSPSELYDPTAGAFSLTGDLVVPRSLHSATLLNDGRVLIAGGQDGTGTFLASAELYSPISETFASTGGMGTPRGTPRASLMQGGHVLVSGAGEGCAAPCPTAVFDPVSETFSVSGMSP